MEFPDKADSYLKEGLRLASLGEVAEAIPQFEHSVRLRPGNSILQYDLALAYQQSGRIADAIAAYQQAVAISPDFFDAWSNLAAAYSSNGQGDAAVASAEKAVNLEPYDPGAHLNLGNALRVYGDEDAAKREWDLSRALENDPVTIHLHTARHLKRDHLAEAWKHIQAALEMAPDHPHAHYLAGVLLLDQGHPQEGLAHLQISVQQAPQPSIYWTKIGQAHLHQNAAGQAADAFENALRCNPDDPDARYGKAWTSLLTGDFAQAWAGFERRWNPGGPRYPNCPVWKGETFHGRTLLLYAEQGLGDAIFFVRYVPLVAERGGRILIECAKPLRRFFQTLPSVSSVFVFGEPAPDFDVQASFFSLPRIFGTTLHQIPRKVPYLGVPEESTVQLPPAESGRMKVGLVWECSGLPLWGQNRSVPLTALAPLLTLSNVSFYSLQVGPGSRQLQESPFHENIIDLGPQLTDFGATASAISQLDLVITVDTSASHVAGALAKPVWVLLPFAPDWRWMLERTDSPWYPTVRLFRPAKPGDWTGVVAAVREALLEQSRAIQPVSQVS